MKLELSNEELTQLVKDKVSALGFNGDLTIEFQARRGGLIDTIIEIGSKNQGSLNIEEPDEEPTEEKSNEVETPTRQY